MALSLTHLSGFMGGGNRVIAPVFETIFTEGVALADTYAVAFPSGIVAGDLALFMIAIPSTGTIAAPTNPSGMTLLGSVTSGLDLRLSVYYKAWAGSESGEFTGDLTGSGMDYTAMAIRISDRQGNPEWVTASNTGTSSPDPDSISPSWGAASQSLIFAFAATYGTPTDSVVSAYPYTGNNNSQLVDSIVRDQTTLSICTKNVRATSENPGAFTLAGSCNAIYGTIAVRAA